ncbi:MAG: CpsD/CapB family tyrosine-protein kinase [Acidobacteria bacterium]|nr:CpsD/CapB family tyrosine-protein kinase [Acidobacteriota bacterium]
MRESSSGLQERPIGGLGRSSVYDTLLYTVFQRPREEEARGTVVAFAAVSPGEGVSYVTRTFAEELATSRFSTVARIDLRALRALCQSSMETLQQSLSRASGNLCEIEVTDRIQLRPERNGRWDGSWQYRRDCIDFLRTQVDYAILDCGSLKQSGDVLSVAPFVDGVILVVEANRTRREQLSHAERTIEAAQGQILGHVLNKRTYPIPDWIYRRL